MSTAHLLAAVALVSVLALKLSGLVAFQTERQETFRAGTDVVQFVVTVVGPGGQPLLGLASEDFSVVERGRQRPIRAFSEVVTPTRGPSGGAWSLDVSSNRFTPGGRVVVIVFDRSIRAGADSIRARSIARAVLDGFGPADIGAVIRTSGFSREGTSQGLTTDLAALRRTVDSPFLGFTEAAAGPPVESGECQCGVCALEALGRIASALEREDRVQKTIVFIGRDITIQDRLPGPCAGAARVARTQAVGALTRANVTVHSVDPSGLETLAATADGLPRTMPAYILARQANLAVLPQLTGGRTLVNLNDPESLVAAIMEETRSYYLVGLDRADVDASPSARLPVFTVRGGARAVVRARRRSNPVRTESPPSATVDVLAQALTPVLPLSDIPMVLALQPTILPDGASAVALQLGVGSIFNLRDAAGPERDLRNVGGRVFDVMVGVFDHHSKLVSASRQSVTPGKSAPLVDDAAFEWHAFFPRKPGRFEIRVALRDPDSGRVGSVYGHVDVPAAYERELSISGVRFELPRGLSPFASAAPRPTVRRQFRQDEPVSIGFVLRAKGPVRDQHVSVELRSSTGNLTSRVVERITAEVFSQSGVAECSIPLAIADLPTGQYLVRVGAAATGGPEAGELVLSLP